MIEYVSIKMICRHTGKHRTSILRALHAAKINPIQFPGVRGVRITRETANQLILKNWPESGRLN